MTIRVLVDDFKKVFIEWKNGKTASFSDKQILSNFEKKQIMT